MTEIQRYPKYGKEFTKYPVLSREDNEMGICPECGIVEIVETFLLVVVILSLMTFIKFYCHDLPEPMTMFVTHYA